jgi:hypothetical protein
MAQWVPYAFPEGQWWSTVEVDFVVDQIAGQMRKRRLLLDTRINESYIFKSSLSNINASEKEFPIAYYHRDGITFTASINMQHIPGPIHWNDDVMLDFIMVDDNGVAVDGNSTADLDIIRRAESVALNVGIPRKKRMPILSYANHAIFKDHADESWIADSAYDYERRTRR